MSKIKILVIILFLGCISMFVFNSQANTGNDETLNQCIQALSLRLKEIPRISKINMVVGFKKFTYEDSVWIALALQSVNTLKPGIEILCHQDQTKSWFLNDDFFDVDIPKEIVDFYLGYISKRDPDFDVLPSPVFIGNENLEVLPGTNKKQISLQQLAGYSDFSLSLISAEILARHGAVFDDPVLKKFFNTRKWYKPDKNFIKSRLSNIEKRNLETVVQSRENLKSSDLKGIAKLLFGDSKFKKVSLGDINKDGKDELLLGITTPSNSNIYEKAMVLRDENNGKYSILLKMYFSRISGKNEEVICTVPKEITVKWKVTVGKDRLLVNFIDNELKAVFDQIELLWSDKLDKYYLLIYPY